MSWLSKIRCLGFLFALLLICGCGGPKIAAVSGTVTYKGKPLEFGLVHFAPVSQELTPAKAEIQADGSYILEVQGDRKAPVLGAYVGEYRVWISCYPYHAPNWNGNPFAKVKSVIPEKYESVETSELTATVVKGKNTFNFDLQ